MSNLDDFLAGYAEAMVWANTYVPSTDDPTEYVMQGDGGPSVTVEYDTPEFGIYAVCEGRTIPQAIALTDARAFYAANLHRLTATGETNFGQHGHDFALTRNGHGAGFWDRGYGPIGDILTERAESYGEANIFF